MNPTKPNITILLLITLMSTINIGWAATASVNRSIITENETVTLVVATENMSTSQIDLSPLETDFEVLGTSQSSRIELFNGAGSSTKQWQITLAPLHSGTLTIPALKVGNETTNVITLSVEAYDAANINQQTAQNVILESTVSKSNIYVQEQIVFSIKLFHSTPIRSGSLSSPNVDNAVVERLGEDVTYQAEKNGKRYSVLERRFVIFPQESGNIEIAPIRFSGQIQDKRAQPRSRFDNFFGQSMFNDPFNPGLKNFRTKSKSHSLTVNPRPAAAIGKHWLPARELIIEENIEDQTSNLDIGQPLTRTITIAATGLNSSQLPELPLPELNSAKSYRDQQNQNNQMSKTGLVGISQQKIALVPTAGGQIHLPEIKIPWWDVAEDRQRYAVLAERTISVNNASKPVANTVLPNSNTAPVTQDDTKEQLQNIVNSGENTPSPWIASSGLFFILWCATLYLLWREKQKRASLDLTSLESKKPTNLRSKSKLVQTACTDGNIHAAHAALLDWAKAYWPDSPPKNLVELASRCNQTTVVSALQNLDRILYSTEKTSWNGKQFFDQVKPLFDQKTPHKPIQATAALPPLYAK